MFAPGAVALAVSVLVLLFFKDSPEAAGFATCGVRQQKEACEGDFRYSHTSSEYGCAWQSAIACKPFSRSP